MSDEIVIHETRYDRLSAIEWWQQDTIQAARVLVVGAGALGNEILKNLALIGIGGIILIDRDVIEISNLSRSILFRDSDQGTPKVTAAAEAIRNINPDVRVIPIHGDVGYDIGWGVLRRVTLIMGGLDSIGARIALNAAAMRVERPWFDAALDELDGIVRVYHPDHACYECTVTPAQYLRMNLSYSCQHVPINGIGHILPTTPTSASLTASLQVQEALRFLHGRDIEESYAVEYRAASLNLAQRTMKRREDCLAHDSIPAEKIIENSRLKITSTVQDVLTAAADSLESKQIHLELDREVITEIRCNTCGTIDNLVRPHYRLTQQDTICPTCGATYDLRTTHIITHSNVEMLSLPLKQLGIPALHLIRAVDQGQGRDIYLELTGDLNDTLYAEFFGRSES